MAETPAQTGKILRGCRAMFGSFDEKNWTCLGKDNDDLSIDTNPDTETVKNVQGETTTNNNGYTPSITVDYLARKEDAIYPHLQYIANTLTTDENKTTMWLIVATLTDEVKDSDVKTLTGTGFKVKTQVVVNNDGGATSGYAIPFTASEDGGRIQGTVSVSNKIPTFTPEGSEEEQSTYSARTTENSNKSSKSLSD